MEFTSKSPSPWFDVETCRTEAPPKYENFEQTSLSEPLQSQQATREAQRAYLNSQIDVILSEPSSNIYNYPELFDRDVFNLPSTQIFNDMSTPLYVDPAQIHIHLPEMEAHKITQNDENLFLDNEETTHIFCHQHFPPPISHGLSAVLSQACSHQIGYGELSRLLGEPIHEIPEPFSRLSEETPSTMSAFGLQPNGLSLDPLPPQTPFEAHRPSESQLAANFLPFISSNPSRPIPGTATQRNEADNRFPPILPDTQRNRRFVISQPRSLKY